MALVEFPSDLPAPLIENYSFSPYQVFDRQQVSDGPPRYRTRSPRYTSIFDIEWHFTEFEFRNFRLWFEGFANLNYNRWFSINLAVGQSQAEGTTRILQNLECHFFNDWQATIEPQSNGWRVRASLEARYRSLAQIEQRIISASSITSPRPPDTYSARSITEERPTDVLTSSTPSFWQ